MNIMRNGGFERGDVLFWSPEGDGVLEISTLLPRYGTYCGRYTCEAGWNNYVIGNDYIEVNPFEIVAVSGWVKSTIAKLVGACIYMYDADYSYIGRLGQGHRTMDTTWLQISTQYMIPYNCAYIRIGYDIISNVITDIFYLDGYMINILSDAQGLSGHLNLYPRTVTTVSGNTSDNPLDMRQFETYYADLQCDIVAGAAPTLDVVVYELDYMGDPVTIGTFAQLVAVGRERIVLTTPVGSGLYIDFVIGGANPSFRFRVDITGKR